ncbi:MAG: DEAD/DEAH box helicase family protein [bacterium]|nr:DEAD/DEAH box helicase family protein [bacterium]
MSEDRVSLIGFQQETVEGLINTIKRVGWYHQNEPQNRKQIGLKAGVSLLQSPTGSGKTLVLGRVLEGLRGDIPGKVIWFWFAPYSGLVVQTRDALATQCGSLRLRDVYTDRQAVNTRDGDVFVQTWDSMRANNAQNRKVRRRTESSGSLDDMLAELRDKGFHIGVVIDEAHLNFGANATASAKLYLDVLQADYTILATATPNDAKLEEFEREAGIEVASRIVIERGQAVDAGLNKVGLKLGYLRFKQEDQKLIDLEQATLMAAWNQHKLVGQELENNDIGITPLMLVQVEDQQKGGEDPVKRVRQKLEQFGVPSTAIKSHTSKEPDSEFHTLAYDPDVEVLIFKVSVATGFDAPRAWTLVSVRPNRGREFGLQIVGRIMRVHPLVRPGHKTNEVLDNGYVFLGDPNIQAGLDAAVEELKAVRQGIELLTDRLDIAEFGNADQATPDVWQGSLPRPVAPTSSDDRQQRLGDLIQIGLLDGSAEHLPEKEQDEAIVKAESVRDLSSTGLFGSLPEQPAPSKGSGEAQGPGLKRYRLRREELGIPEALVREELPPIHEVHGDLLPLIAARFCDDTMLKLLHVTKRKADLSLRELFNGESEERQIDVRLSNARVAEQAQKELEFNDSIDVRKLRLALVGQLETLADKEGIEAERADFRRAIDLMVMQEPDRIHEAIRHALTHHMRSNVDLPIPEETDDWPDNLEAAEKGAYGVFPHNMNKEERAFAKLLDQDTSGTVKWWLRNPESVKWATRIILPTGRRFFPDFAVGIAGRKSTDEVALVEIKDDGETGRLHSDINLLKVRVRHKEYGHVTWTYRQSEKRWVEGEFNSLENRIVAAREFGINALVLDE